MDGRLVPGDRLVFVNDVNLENATLDEAVQALKGAQKGLVRIGVAKPLPLAGPIQELPVSDEESEVIYSLFFKQIPLYKLSPLMINRTYLIESI